MKGKVKFFNCNKGFGQICSTELEELVFVDRSQIQNETQTLLDGEDVEFELQKTERGYQAQKVRQLVLEERFEGIVISFDKGFGFIQDEQHGKIFVNHTDIISQRKIKRLEAGERVQYSHERNEKGLCAKRVLRLDTRRPLEKFAVLGDFNFHLGNLAKLAPENWDYGQNPKHSYPVLYNYIHYTFERLEQEGKIAETDNSGPPAACFNTGLATKNQEEIFAYFEINKLSDVKTPKCKWLLKGFFENSSRYLTVFARRPDIANYFENPADLLYDTNVDLVVDYVHIIEDNVERFPRNLQSDPLILRGSIESAVNAALRRVKRNYKTAIPQYNRGRVQLLLPLCITSMDKADLALVVSRENQVYRGETVLTLDMAYNNARLLARPDREWLDP